VAGKNCPYPYPKNRNKKRGESENMEQIIKHLKILNKPYVLIPIIILIGLIGTYRSCTVQKKGIYTIATIYNIEGGRGGMAFDFKYDFQSKEYKSYASGSDIKRSDEGKRFFIQVLPNDPERCKMTNIRVPDSITQAPYSGWKELPIPKE
jgi:hypothetical protein